MLEIVLARATFISSVPARSESAQGSSEIRSFEGRPQHPHTIRLWLDTYNPASQMKKYLCPISHIRAHVEHEITGANKLAVKPRHLCVAFGPLPGRCKVAVVRSATTNEANDTLMESPEHPLPLGADFVHVFKYGCRHTRARAFECVFRGRAWTLGR